MKLKKCVYVSFITLVAFCPFYGLYDYVPKALSLVALGVLVSEFLDAIEKRTTSNG